MSVRTNSLRASNLVRTATHDNIAIELHNTETDVAYVFYKSKFGTMRSFSCATDPDVAHAVHAMFAALHRDPDLTAKLDTWLTTNA